VAKKGGDDAAAQQAAQARADEAARQAKIRDGTARINSLFDGTPYKPPASPFADALGRIPGLDKIPGLNNIPGLSGPTTETPATANTFKGFTDDFYKGREKAYSDFATPQLEDQQAEARKQLTFALDRSKLLDSSARAEQEATLGKIAGTARQGIADTARTTSNQARSAVEAARADLINMLNVTGDVEGTINNALSRSATLSAPQQFSPLGSMFANFTSALGTQAQAERAQYYSGGAVRAPFNTGLFAPSSSVRVT